MFEVTTLNLNNPPRKEDGSIDYSQDFLVNAPILQYQVNLRRASCLALGAIILLARHLELKTPIPQDTLQSFG